jgi:hypothetical protein
MGRWRPPAFEPASRDPESRMIGHYTTGLRRREGRYPLLTVAAIWNRTCLTAL